MRLQEFLAKKPLFYKEIDYTRMPKAYALIKKRIKLPKIIHIVGTNGKGSTGRFLSGIIKEAGYSVGHYTSPHILKFNERIWIDGRDIDDDSLEKAHQKLQTLLPKEVSKALSYFEYTTFLAAILFEDLDYAVMEAGLGGEFDATAVFENILTLVTPIGLDHQDFLGRNVKEIAKTKLNAIQKRAVIGYQPYSEVKERAKSYPARFIKKDFSCYERVCEREGLAPYFAKNLALAVEGARELGIGVKDMNSIVKYRLKARAQRIRNVILDVGHNPMSAKALREILRKDTVLVYNSFEDKDFKEILKILKPRIKRVEIIPVKSGRVVERGVLERALRELGISYGDFLGLKDSEEYLVYGSFSVVEEFLKRESEILRIFEKN